MSRTNETRHIKWHKHVNDNAYQMQALIINNVGIKINADVNANNQLTKEYVLKDLFGILVIVITNVINHVTQRNIQTKKIVNVENNYQQVS